MAGSGSVAGAGGGGAVGTVVELVGAFVGVVGAVTAPTPAVLARVCDELVATARAGFCALPHPASASSVPSRIAVGGCGLTCGR
jgi:hypothetical protein